ncbi:MAG: glycosyltransferase family 2 protein [Marinifilaceae bacterium]
MSKVAVVILNWNGRDLLERYLPSVCKNTNNKLARIYVADNASTDDSVAFVKETYPDLEIIQLDENHGFAGGYNKALAALKEKYFVLLNSDVDVAPKWVEPILEQMEADASIAAAQPKILSDRDRSSFEYAGACGGFIDYLGFPFCRGRVLDNLEKDNGQYDSTIDVFWCSGAALFIRAELYKKVGGLDAKFFAHMEEIDLCWQLNSMGYKLICEPRSTVYHFGGATLDYNNPRKLYLNFRNSLLMMYKNLPANKLFYIMFKRMLLDGVAAVKFLLKFEFLNFKAVWNAHIDFYKMVPAYKLSRKQVQANSSIISFYTVITKSMVWLYYFKRERSFSDYSKYFRTRN